MRKSELLVKSSPEVRQPVTKTARARIPRTIPKTVLADVPLVSVICITVRSARGRTDCTYLPTRVGCRQPTWRTPIPDIRQRRATRMEGKTPWYRGSFPQFESSAPPVVPRTQRNIASRPAPRQRRSARAENPSRGSGSGGAARPARQGIEMRPSRHSRRAGQTRSTRTAQDHRHPAKSRGSQIVMLKIRAALPRTM
jgi:hypothetical protein